MMSKKLRDMAAGWSGSSSAPELGSRLLKKLSLFLRKLLAIHIVQISGDNSVRMVAANLMVRSTDNTAQTTSPSGFECTQEMILKLTRRVAAGSKAMESSSDSHRSPAARTSDKLSC
jgi:hypothetical protein